VLTETFTLLYCLYYDLQKQLSIILNAACVMPVVLSAVVKL